MDPETLGRKLIGSEDERAVSPVIGVILMVAITVILAAVIAAFVLDIGDTGEPVQANLDIDNIDGNSSVSVTITNADNVDEIFVRCGDNDRTVLANGDGADLSVGSTADVDLDVCDDGNINVIGEADGSESIIKSFDYEDDS